jgi:hypothetical protein
MRDQVYNRECGMSDARAHWAERLVTYYFVDLDLLCESLSKSLPSTVRQITGKAIQDLMLVHIDAAHMSGWHRVISQKHYVGVPLFVRRYTKWVKSVGQALGFDCANLDFEDDWADASMPELQAILWGLTDRLRADLPVSKSIKDPSAMARALESLQRSIARGETLEQAHARAERAAHGLRSIK